MSGPGGQAERAERVLVVSPYPPVRDGIGAYALQQVAALRRVGHHVEVCSPVPSAAHHHRNLRGAGGAAALARLGRGFDRVIIHFHPDVFYRLPPTVGSRVATAAGLGVALRRLRHVELRLHEIDHRWGERAGDPSGRATAWMLAGADAVTVHSPQQRDELIGSFGLHPGRVTLVAHGGDFARRTRSDRATARATLGLPDDEYVFLCIGFVQPHKGFDRAGRAFAGLAERGARLDIVGSTRVDDQNTLDHVNELRRITTDVAGVHLHLGFVSDEAFDRWIVAADTVVLPYRHIWSSSVVERAALYGRPVIATRVGGLADQLADVAGATIVDDNVELARAMARAMGAPDDLPAAAATWPSVDDDDGGDVQHEIRVRAAAARGGVAPRRGGSADAGTGAGTGEASEPASAALRRIRPLQPPAPVSERPGVSVLKRLIHRVIAWELNPLTDQVNRIQRAAADAVDAASHDADGTASTDDRR